MSNVTAHFFTKLRNVMINMLEKLPQNSLLLEINIYFFSIWCVIGTEILLNKKYKLFLINSPHEQILYVREQLIKWNAKILKVSYFK